MANGSFYQNGLPISSAETGLGNVDPGAPVPNPASSSFYLSGTVYQTLENQDALLALLTADTALVAADLVAANVAAANSAASAAAAAATLAASMLKANNLSDVASVSQAKINLSLVKADVGLGSVDNTSDVNKPVSTAQATADALVASNAAAATALKANIASPALTGTPSAPTAAALNNSTQLATTAYADAAVSTLSGTVNTALALKAPLASPALTGVPVAPTAAVNTNTTQLATTAYVLAQAAVATPIIDGTATVGTATKFAREDHVHPTDTSRAPLASPTFTGVPAAPTATAGTNTTQIATTAFVTAAVSGAGVSSVGGVSGAITLTAADLAMSGSALQLSAGRKTKPTQQVFLTGGGTYSTPANALWITVELIGGGGGGAGSGTSPGAAGDGVATTFGSSFLTGSGGIKAVNSAGGAGGAATGGTRNRAGAAGSNGSGANTTPGGLGGCSPYGGFGGPGAPGGGAGVAAAVNSGSGGGGGGVNTTVNGGGGGGSGGWVFAVVTSPAATYAYAVGAGGSAGTAGTGGAAGGAGGSGCILVTEYYN
jgi:hypothetical protein